jgi:hypothetical protein
LPDQLNNDLISSLKAAIDPNADVRVICQDGTGRAGIWLRPALSDSDSQARNRGLQRLAILGNGENFACFISASLIQSKALDKWNMMPKRINHDGQADPNGPVHLTGFSVSFNAPNSIVTQIDGFDETPWPDVSFHLSITDTLSASGGAIQCQSARKLDTDTSWLNILTGILFLGVGLSPWFLLPAIFFLTERIIIGSVGAPPGDGGVGCAAAQLSPTEIFLPRGFKIDFFYSRLSVTPGGIFAGGSFVPLTRTPSVNINGPAQAAASDSDTSVMLSYSAGTHDMRGQLQFQWTGDGTISNTTGGTTNVRFDLGTVQAKQVLKRRLAVSVTDQDGLNAQAGLDVSIHITATVDDGGVPPICRHKPWLPVCQPL